MHEDVVSSIILGNQMPTWKITKLIPDLETRYAGYIGIDPGATGAIALLDENGNFMTVFDYQGSPPTMWSLLQDLKNVRIKLAVLEQVHSMPKQGVATTFKFGTNYGIWQMACAAMGWPMELITPQRWRKILDSSVPLKPTKEDLRQYALRRWPEANNFLQRKGDHGRAEAMIMAMYARMRVLGEAK
jgi:crossover junction endodeoxyribonuclease RuvC